VVDEIAGKVKWWESNTGHRWWSDNNGSEGGGM